MGIFALKTYPVNQVGLPVGGAFQENRKNEKPKTQKLTKSIYMFAELFKKIVKNSKTHQVDLLVGRNSQENRKKL